jgi:hypothetical protein
MSSGLVIFVPSVNYRTSCPATNVEGDDPYAALAVRECTVKIGSWTYPKSEVDIIPKQNVGENLQEADWEGSPFVGEGAGGRLVGKTVSLPHHPYPRQNKLFVMKASSFCNLF